MSATTTPHRPHTARVLNHPEHGGFAPRRSGVWVTRGIVAMLSAALSAAGLCTAWANPPSAAASVAPTPIPRSIVLVPALNRSTAHAAPTATLPQLGVSLAEKGYYVFPVNTTRVVLEQAGFHEGAHIHAQSAATLTQLFGADAVLYVAITRWAATQAGGPIQGEFEFRLVSRDGTVLWQATQRSQWPSAPADQGTTSATDAQHLAQATANAITTLGLADGPYRHRAPGH